MNLSRFGTSPNRNRAGPVTDQTGPVPTGLVNPGHEPAAFQATAPGEQILERAGLGATEAMVIFISVCVVGK